MKKLDIMLQGIALMPGLMLLLFSVFMKEFLLFVMILQFVLGVYQLLSALMRLILRNQVKPMARKLLTYYWLAAIACMTIIGFTINNIGGITFYWVLMLVVIPWCIAWFYFYISWIDTYGKAEVRSKFLPNIDI